ncbi:hypothetical protein VPH35_114578 [Triticum aestivum]|uniref:uncharacterized protein n=1 Tax=Triticum aestivum TaxID=4565 RepID=UPI001D00292D|nr:uncharacterized protein LOC123140741 [Triticum aestivum]
MDFRSRRRLRRSPPPRGPGGDDLISALPDDMLLQILLCLRCTRAAACTGVLSRRWRGLWARLPGLTFRDVPAAVVKAALGCVPRRTSMSLLDVRLMRSVSKASRKLDDAHAKMLLRAAERLSPEELVFILPREIVFKPGPPVSIVMPCFRRATSIELDTGFLCVKPPQAGGKLPALERLSLSGNIVDIGAFLDRCPRLRLLRVTFREVEARSLQAALATLESAVALGLTVSLLGLECDQIKNWRRSVSGVSVASLLCAAARLSPQELIFTNNSFKHIFANLPSFHRATSAEMELRTFRFTQLPARDFSALERLCLRGCTIVNLVTMLALCPRLRVLKVMADRSARDVKINSESLQELDLSVYGVVKCQGLQIMTPLLKQLKLKVCSNPDLRVSISTPMVEKVSWLLTYSTESSLIFGFWSLQSMRLQTIGSYKYNDGVSSNQEEDACLRPPGCNVLSLYISAYLYDRLGAAMDFAPEMEKLPVANFTVLELHLNAMGHVLGGLLRHLLMMHQIQTATQRLKVFLWDWSRANCLENCPCDEPKNWRSQSISLTRLEEVEINNFRGRDREMDLVTVALRWAPRLKTMTIKLADETGIERCATNIYNICLAYPSVNCSVYCHSGRLV